MAKKWAEVVNSEAYQALSDQQKSEAKNQYFNQVVIPQLPDASAINSAKRQFLSLDDNSLIQKAPEKNNGSNALATMAGPAMNTGVNWAKDAVSGGVSYKDIPFIASEIASGAVPGLKQLAQNPVAGAMEAGITGFSHPNSVYPEPFSQGGEQLGGRLGMVASFIPALEGLQAIVGPAKAATKGAAKSASNRLMNSVLKPGIDVLEKNPNIGFDAAKAGLTGSSQNIYSKSMKLITENEQKLQKILEQSSGSVPLKRIIDSLDELKLDFVKVGDDSSINAIDKLKSGLSTELKTSQALKSSVDPMGLSVPETSAEVLPDIPVKQANELKRSIYKTLRDSQYGTNEVPATTQGRKAAAGKIKRAIERAEPNQPIAQINKKTSLAANVRDAIERQDLLNSRRGINLADTGLFAGAVGTGNPALWATLTSKKLADSGYVRSKLAELLSKLA